MKIADAMKIVIAMILASVLLNVGCVEEDTVFVPEPVEAEEIAPGRTVDREPTQEEIEAYHRYANRCVGKEMYCVTWDYHCEPSNRCHHICTRFDCE